MDFDQCRDQVLSNYNIMIICPPQKHLETSHDGIYFKKPFEKKMGPLKR